MHMIYILTSAVLSVAHPQLSILDQAVKGSRSVMVDKALLALRKALLNARIAVRTDQN